MNKACNETGVRLSLRFAAAMGRDACLQITQTSVSFLKMGLLIVQVVTPRDKPSSLSKELHSILPFIKRESMKQQHI